MIRPLRDFSVAVRAQELVVCHNELGCSGMNLGTATPRDCCVENVFGQSFSRSEGRCVNCLGKCKY